jgi:TatA/E family protein of Tat protein translocase
MIGSLGFPEIVFILLLALLVFGPKRLPEVGRKVGRALGEFRRATGDLKRTIDRELTMAEMEPPEQARAGRGSDKERSEAQPVEGTGETGQSDAASDSSDPS